MQQGTAPKLPRTLPAAFIMAPYMPWFSSSGENSVAKDFCMPCWPRGCWVMALALLEVLAAEVGERVAMLMSSERERARVIKVEER